ncbi:MAG: ABC transporter permease [Chromatiaceae bacterium]|nr:ABC transporter permease [Chromatiaceae bacterium]MCP5316158.1 ABC transporter permease [Chromatiaceae bacterium]
MYKTIYRQRLLLLQLIKRDVLLRYRGAMFGVFWMFLSPLLMLAIFAFVFSQIFQTRWPQEETGAPFWLMLYAGLIIFNLFADPVSRSPGSVRSYPSYVKKIIFPVEILPLVPVGSALIHAAFNFAILAIALALTGHLSIGVLLLPILTIPVIFLGVGLSWFIAAWGVFIKDLSQIVPLFTQMLLFLSPVFYPVNAVPAFLRPLYQYNPLGAVIETSRALILHQAINWTAWSIALATAIIVAALGHAFFQYSRDEFPDAI